MIAPWYNDAMANPGGWVGALTDQLPVDSGNFHIRARSKLQVHPLTFVRQEALAHRLDEEGTELAAQRGPPALMEEAARHAVRQLGSSTTSALTNMPTSAQQAFDQRVSVITPCARARCRRPIAPRSSSRRRGIA